MKKLLYLFIVSGILLCACRHTDSTALLRQADAVVYGNADSAMKLLSLIKNPERLPFEEKMLYGWLRTFAHNVRGASMAEDICIGRKSIKRLWLYWIAVLRRLRHVEILI